MSPEHVRGFDHVSLPMQDTEAMVAFYLRGSAAGLQSVLDAAGAEIVEGPVEREGGRRAAGTSVYVRDPDGNLLEFIRYRAESADVG